MHVIDALKQRKSTRAFLDKVVTTAQIERILDAARHAPSAANTQPWQVAVVMGESKKALEQKLEQAFQGGETPAMDYTYYPQQWQAPYKERRGACAVQMYQALNIQREDKEKRRSQWAANYRAFDAPVVLFFFLDSVMETGSFMDYGMFLQSVMLTAQAEGLATCPQAALGEYPQIVKQSLGYAQDTVLLCGMALGYEDTDTEVNHYRTPREDVTSFTRFFS
ncbi:nitroreductase [Candidatus Venteria ishoeyi]|uniref:Nitroreductase A n=1 Tax=Candidatus Venteria ishoeyi TaxID=1899563 RepID=A0A1H6FAJ3_9GAMM|nr:nitroreductase [Candidatus Venteria ishoeyi]SEH06025.1 nitroreductase A [Candidatus Venteria ishoeyi]